MCISILARITGLPSWKLPMTPLSHRGFRELINVCRVLVEPQAKGYYINSNYQPYSVFQWGKLPRAFTMPYKNTSLFKPDLPLLTELSIYNLRSPMSAHQPESQASGVLFCFPQWAIFELLVPMIKACKRVQNLSLKTNTTSRKGFPSHFLIFGRR